MTSILSVDSLHGSVINYEQIKHMPTRNAFLDQSTHKEINELISKNKTLLFMPNSIHEMHLQDAKFNTAKYKIVLFGILLDGRRATVVLNDLKPYFEVVIKESAEALNIYNKLKQTKYACPISFDIIKGKQFDGYSKERKTFARLYFDKLKMRNEAIKFVKSQGMSTTSDDSSCYYRVICRDYMTTFSSWVNISNYNVKTYTGIRGAVYDVSINDYKVYEGDVTENPQLAKDNSMSMAWDIETYSPDGDIPLPDNPLHRLFMLSATFQWYHSDKQLLRVCLVEHPCNARPGYLTIVCGDEKKIIKAFGKLAFKMKPEFNLGFNDSEYDWPWVVKRAASYAGVLPFLAECFDSTSPWKNYDEVDIMRYNFKKEKVKLEADAYAEGSTLVLPGYINIDVRTVFRQLYPTSEKSNLNFYLSLNKLDSKKDMPYQELFSIYRQMGITFNKRAIIQSILSKHKINSAAVLQYYDEYESLKEKMADIAEYCVVDSQRCHELMKIRSVVTDKREVSNLSYTSVFDSFYRANGMKVRNLVIARGQKRGIKFSNIAKFDSEEGKYPGAYVFPPKKGLVTSKLSIHELRENARELAGDSKLRSEWAVVSDDEIALYIKIISENKSIMSDKEIDTLVAQVPNLRKCFLDFLALPTGRPITGLDFSSLYPSLMMTYNLSPEYIIKDIKEAKEAMNDGHTLHKIKFMFNNKWVRGWSIRHDNKLDVNDKDCKFGIYPMILKDLFDSRSLLKKRLQKWEHEKERLNMLSADEFNQPHIKEEYDNVNFNYNYLDSKQKALKVFMNTFYGETGNKNSPFFVLQLAGAITSSGQDNIKMVQKYVEDEGCNVYYGDTDSIYSAMPEKHFIELDKMYYTGQIDKLKYWEEMVNITFREIAIINDAVNVMLIKDNGTKFLKMAFEESLFPVAFLAKKKYYGIPHISQPNFQPKDLFVRGLEVKKRGVSEFLRKVCFDIMWDSVNVSNIYNLMELVNRKIDYIYSKKWDFDDFIMTDIFKPNKNNIKIHTFVRRMISENIVVKPFERFQYVIVKKNPYTYDTRGRKQDISIGDKMELYEVATKNKLDIDLDYYMKGSINGQLARLVTYADTFHTEPLDDSVDELKIAEDKTYNNACKYIENYCDKYYAKYSSKGKIYQKIFKVANNIIKDKLNEFCSPEAVNILANYDIENIEKWLFEKAEKDAMKSNTGHGARHINNLIKDLDDEAKHKKIQELQNIYFANRQNNLSSMHKKIFEDRNAVLKRQVSDNMKNLIAILNHHSGMINVVQEKIKKSLNIGNLFNGISEEVPDFDSLAADLDNSELDTIARREINNLSNNKMLVESMNKLRYIYINILCNYNFIQKTNLVADYLVQCRNNTISLKPRPKNFDVKKTIKNNVDDILLELKADKK